MAYTRPWTKNNPPGGQAANTADDEIRNLREDTEERMAALVTGWTTGAATDPIVVKPEILGNVAGKRYLVHHSAFDPDVSWDSPTLTSTFLRTALFTEHSAADPNIRSMWCPLTIPPGVTITGVDFLVNRNGAGNMTVKFVKNDFTVAPASDASSSTVTAANGIVILSLAPAYLVLDTKMLALEVVFPVSQAARLYGAKIIYTTPDCRNTQ